MNETISTIYNTILDGDVAGAKEGVQTALMGDLQPEDILADGMIAAMNEVGRRFEAGDYYVPEMLVAASAMQAALFLLKPRLWRIMSNPLVRLRLVQSKVTCTILEKTWWR